MASLKYKRFSELAHLPTLDERWPGFGLHSIENKIVVPHRGMVMCDTGLGFIFPPGYYGRVMISPTINSSVQVGAGIIDSDYRGSVRVLLFNLGTTPVTVGVGDVIAQLICVKLAQL